MSCGTDLYADCRLAWGAAAFTVTSWRPMDPAAMAGNACMPTDGDIFSLCLGWGGGASGQWVRGTAGDVAPQQGHTRTLNF